MNAECGMGNAELNWKVARRATLIMTFRIPHFAFRIGCGVLRCG